MPPYSPPNNSDLPSTELEATQRKVNRYRSQSVINGCLSVFFAIGSAYAIQRADVYMNNHVTPSDSQNDVAYYETVGLQLYSGNFAIDRDGQFAHEREKTVSRCLTDPNNSPGTVRVAGNNVSIERSLDPARVEACYMRWIDRRTERAESAKRSRNTILFFGGLAGIFAAASAVAGARSWRRSGEYAVKAKALAAEPNQQPA